MNWQSVQSSNIAAIGYDSETRTLGMRFKGGGEYHYDDVLEDEYQKLIGAKSHGRHFHSFIKTVYSSKKIEEK